MSRRTPFSIPEYLYFVVGVGLVFLTFFPSEPHFWAAWSLFLMTVPGSIVVLPFQYVGGIFIFGPTTSAASRALIAGRWIALVAAQTVVIRGLRLRASKRGGQRG